MSIEPYVMVFYNAFDIHPASQDERTLILAGKQHINLPFQTLYRTDGYTAK
jgi:hypothetical protein